MTEPRISSRSPFSNVELWGLAKTARQRMLETSHSKGTDSEEWGKLMTVINEAGLWPWIRLQEKVMLESAGYPAGHISTDSLPPRELWTDASGEVAAWLV